MQYPNLFKRIVPFALAVILGLFVASFFVNLAPTFKFRARRQQEVRRIKAENEELKLEIQRLRVKHPCDAEFSEQEEFVTPMRMDAVPLPPPPPKLRHHGSEGIGSAR